ncbi:MAG: peptidylprolyl isomerase [Desulfovibrio sp.]|nr:peptidylprolyl isomerase [Desulfovibrio sp.]|tara:strand:- start:490 stop:1116 length:627 start_codon:yes stop_codon:yes gene_type:complete
MKQIISRSLCLLILGCLLTVGGLNATTASAAPTNPVVIMETTKGTIFVMLDAKAAPISVANFLTYVKAGFYDNTIFHRVIRSKQGMNIVQGGGFASPMQNKRALAPPIKIEDTNGLSNVEGTIAMARTGNPNSATSQFFFNVKDNLALDAVKAGYGNKIQRHGYAVFGKVIRGMQVVEEINKVPTSRRGMFEDVPKQTVILKRAYLAN